MIRHPEKKRAGETDDYMASTHDVGPTMLGAAGAKVPRAMEGEDLTVLFEGGKPGPRTYFTSGLKDHVCAGDDDWLFMCTNQREEVELFDRRSDPRELKNVAAKHPQMVKRWWRRVLDDAGGRPLPRF